MEARPKLKLDITPTDKFIEAAGWVALGCLWVLTLACYTQLPEIIPIHFNLSGEVNDHGNKMSILFLPVIATLIFIGLTVLNLYPHLFNYPANITADNAARQYLNATRMIRFMRLMIALVFSMLVYMIYQAATGNAKSVSFWFLPVTLGAIIIPLAYFAIKAVKLK